MPATTTSLRRSKRVAVGTPKPRPVPTAPVAAAKKKKKPAKAGLKDVAARKPATRKPANVEYDVQSIVDSKIVRKKLFYKVHWVGYDKSEDTWEPEENLSNAQEMIKAFDVKYPNKP